MKQIQSQINQQLIGRIPNQLSSSYRKMNDRILGYQNKIQVTKDDNQYDLNIITPGYLKSNKFQYMFNWKINFIESQLCQFSKDEFYQIYLYNCFLLGDCYKANSLSYIQQKYRHFESYFDIKNENRNNILLYGENMKEFNEFKLSNSAQNEFTDFNRIYVNKRNQFVSFSVYDIINSNDKAIQYFQKLVQQKAFQNIDEALLYYGVTLNEIEGLNVHQLLHLEKLIPGNVQSYRQNYQNFYEDIAFSAYTLHVNQFHRNVPNMSFSTNECEQCNSGNPAEYCTSLKPIQPLKQPQLIPIQQLQEYPLSYKTYDIICILYHSLICQLKIWSHQDSVESILNYQVVEEALVTSQSNFKRNYENLELLGDSVLKYVVTVDIFKQYELLDEGEMTSLRSRLIMNTFLAQLFEQLGLEHYIINQDLHFKQIRNPLVNDIISSENKHLQISQKADIYEAIIGGVFESTQSLYEYITILRRTNFPISFYQDILFDFQPITDSIEHIDIKEYQFNNPQLYEIAINPLQYDRLEFLGDAAIELLVISYIFKVAREKQQKNPNWILNPGVLSNWKQLLLGNKFMGEQTIKMGLKPHIDEIPKLYGDIFESVAAAILLDSGWKGLNQVYGSLYKKYMDEIIEQ
uniref:Dicer-like protein n=1 Tax=Paramecium biaurelia TaxID=65126 RepID=W1I782_9CILI|nr:Dicer-like protein [Paramecium biaurelia]